jgi:hypothetical protein
MDLKISKFKMQVNDMQSHAFLILPKMGSQSDTVAVFTHGYTAHKGQLLTWGNKLAGSGIPTIIFDLPGHYLGDFNEVTDAEKFLKVTPIFFEEALKYFPNTPKNLIIGGHSLGGLLALMAGENPKINEFELNIIGVGVGMAPETGTHLFEHPFYRETLNLRAQLVSPAIDPDTIFPLLKKLKEETQIQNTKIHLISGMDDLVVGNDGVERLKEHLEKKNNIVSINRPKKLAHHLPEQAASFIKKYLKDIGLIPKI